MAILKIRDANGNAQEILAIRGKDGKDYVLTDADKQEIANMVSGGGGGTVDLSRCVQYSEDAVGSIIMGNFLLGGNDEPVVSPIGVSNGITISDNTLQLSRATEDNITARDPVKPIIAKNIDYAVKEALSNPQNISWTEEEKAAARATLGIVSGDEVSY